jgi:heptosyltransferase II
MSIKGSLKSLAQGAAGLLLPPAVRLFCGALGLGTWFFTERREDSIRNLTHAFPEKSAGWQRKTAFKSVVRMFEMFAMPVVLPWLGEKELRKRFRLAPGSEATFKALSNGSVSVVVAPHCASMEAMAVLPLICPGARFTTIYRALDFPPAEKYVLWARTRWGMKFLSRQEGLLGIRRAMSQGDSVGILFDQNALNSGALILSFGRICSATDLPGILASKLHLKTYLIYAKRTGFLSADFDIVEIENDGTDADVTVRTTLVLENIMKADEDICADWMWAHRRWKSPISTVKSSLSLAHKKNFLSSSLKVMGLARLPRRQPYCLRLPGDPELAKAIISWLPKIREARPDVRWIVAAPVAVADLLKEGINCDRVISFEKECADKAMRDAGAEWPEIYLDLDASSDSRRDGKLCRAFRSMGLTTDKNRKKRGYHKVMYVEGNRLTPEGFDGILSEFLAKCGYAPDKSAE